jgi:hypothetical protein
MAQRPSLWRTRCENVPVAARVSGMLYDGAGIVVCRFTAIATGLKCLAAELPRIDRRATPGSRTGRAVVVVARVLIIVVTCGVPDR